MQKLYEGKSEKGEGGRVQQRIMVDKTDCLHGKRNKFQRILIKLLFSYVEQTVAVHVVFFYVWTQIFLLVMISYSFAFQYLIIFLYG